MPVYKQMKVMIVLSVHVVWSILVFVCQGFIVNTNKNFRTSYNLNILFNNAEGIKKGTPINYRGVKIGEVLTINLHSDYVIVTTYIKSPKILIPLNAYVKTYKTIFIADTTLHICNRDVQTLNGFKNTLQQNVNLGTRQEWNSINYNKSFCYHNDFLYGFQGTSFDNLIDILVRLSIQLDNIELLDMLYNTIYNFSQIIIDVQQQLSSNV